MDHPVECLCEIEVDCVHSASSIDITSPIFEAVEHQTLAGSPSSKAELLVWEDSPVIAQADDGFRQHLLKHSAEKRSDRDRSVVQRV